MHGKSCSESRRPTAESTLRHTRGIPVRRRRCSSQRLNSTASDREDHSPCSTAAPALVRRLPLLRHIQIRQHPGEGLGRHREGLGERRVGMDGEGDVLGLAAHLDRQRGFRNEVAGVRPDDAAADRPLRRLVPQRLGQALVAPERKRAPARGPREDRLAVSDALGLGLRLGEADPGDLRIGVGDRASSCR